LNKLQRSYLRPLRTCAEVKTQWPVLNDPLDSSPQVVANYYALFRSLPSPRCVIPPMRAAGGRRTLQRA